jgi:hypothetical protein
VRRMPDKKTHQVNVRLTASDWQAIIDAGRKRWSGLEVPVATIVRAFALERAEEILSKVKK